MEQLKIGDRVKVKNWEEIEDSKKISASSEGDPRFWSRGKAKTCGKVGKIVDRLFSEAFNCYTYTVQFDGADYPSRSSFDEDSLVLFNEEKRYHYEIESDGTKVNAILYETDAYGVSTEVARGRGFLYENGVAGFAQAASYALKQIYDTFRGEF